MVIYCCMLLGLIDILLIFMKLFCSFSEMSDVEVDRDEDMTSPLPHHQHHVNIMNSPVKQIHHYQPQQPPQQQQQHQQQQQPDEEYEEEPQMVKYLSNMASPSKKIQSIPEEDHSAEGNQVS